MQFLDAIGLAYFWKKIKNWVNINYLSLTGGTIRGSVSFLRGGDGGSSITISPLNITKSGCGDNYLFASGKMIPIGEANGVAGLDANGNVPLAQLGNLDTTVAEVVTALPTTNIIRSIFILLKMRMVIHRINIRNIFILVIPVQLMMLQNGRNLETSVLQ